MSENGNGKVSVPHRENKGIANLRMWPKGVSGNPNGAPKRPRFENYANDEDAKEAYGQLVTAMKGGDSWAIMYYLDQFFGKPRQRTEITGENGGPVEFAAARDELERKLARIAQAEETGTIPESN